jgi:hypothetical protein
LTTIRTITDTLLIALYKAGVTICKVDRCTESGDSDGIYLNDDHALFVDYEAFPIVCISLDEIMPVGGNVQIADWTFKDDATVYSVVNAIKLL